MECEQIGTLGFERDSWTLWGCSMDASEAWEAKALGDQDTGASGRPQNGSDTKNHLTKT